MHQDEFNLIISIIIILIKLIINNNINNFNNTYIQIQYKYIHYSSRPIYLFNFSLLHNTNCYKDQIQLFIDKLPQLTANGLSTLGSANGLLSKSDMILKKILLTSTYTLVQMADFSISCLARVQG